MTKLPLALVPVETLATAKRFAALTGNGNEQFYVRCKNGAYAGFHWADVYSLAIAVSASPTEPTAALEGLVEAVRSVTKNNPRSLILIGVVQALARFDAAMEKG